jgi:hypothetical protein
MKYTARCVYVITLFVYFSLQKSDVVGIVDLFHGRKSDLQIVLYFGQLLIKYCLNKKKPSKIQVNTDEYHINKKYVPG